MNRRPPMAFLSTSLVFGAGCDHQVIAADIAEPVKDLGHPHGDGGLSRSGPSGEAHVEHRTFGGETDLPAEAVYEEKRGNLANACLNFLQSDELVVQLVQHLLDAGVLEGLSDVQQFPVDPR